MKVPRTEIALATATLVLGAAALVRWRSAVPPGDGAPLTVARSMESAAIHDRKLLGESALTTTEQDPFRLSRTPSDVPYVPKRAAPAAPAPAAPAFRPTLVLKGIIGGPPWQAILDGIPGEPAGTVVSAGRTFERLVIRAITRDTVVVQAPDTVWHLTLSKGPR
jgi:hypothetical protein